MLGHSLKKLNNNDQGIALMGVIIIFIIVGVISITTMVVSSRESFMVQDNLEHAQSLYVSETGLKSVLFKLKTYGNWDNHVWTGVGSATTSTGSATLDSINFAAPGTATASITVTGNYKGDQRQVQADVRYDLPMIYGAGSFRATTPTINGSALIDGRNHDKNGNLIANATGTYGLVTTETPADFGFGGSVVLGATSKGMDHVPLHTTVDRMLFESDDLPPSPDAIFNLPEGTLRSIADANNRLYNHSIGNLSDGNFTVHDGVTYVEPDCTGGGSSWRPVLNMHNPNANAILVVHNTCSNSTYNGNMGIETDTFRGIMIVDNLQRIHSRFIGAVIGIGTDSNINLGNGLGKILYSRELVTDLIESYVPSNTQLNLTTFNWQENAL